MPNRTILVVEDHQVVRRSLCDWIGVSFQDYRVVEAASAEQALEIARVTPPALVLMDIGLPQMNGINATREIKRTAAHIPVIVVSIHESPAYQADALAAGANAYLPKRKLHSDLFQVMAQLLNAAPDLSAA